MSAPEESRPTPPYTGFKTFSNLIERMEQEGVPARLDRFYLSNMAGGTRQQITAALRSLGLVDEDNRTTPVLTEYVTRRDDRPDLMAQILQKQFPDVVELSAQGNATQGQLLELVTSYGIQGETSRKAATFLVAAMTFANLPVSPHFATVRPSTSGGSRKGPTRKRRPEPAPRPASPKAADAEDLKKQYFNLLLDKARDSGDGDTDLLDRIERLIGVVQKD
jgi:hypothetical protein